MSTDDLVTYEGMNRVLMSVPKAFGKRPNPVSSWVWKSDIKVGAVIQPGRVLADIQWEDNTIEPVGAPKMCNGKISWINLDIDTVQLSLPDSAPLALLKLA
jgi:hypothetical protein